MKIPRLTPRWYAVAALGVANVLVFYLVATEVPSNVLAVTFLDVGQSDAIFVEGPTGNQMLIDGGPPGARVLRELGSVMPIHDRFIDVVVATHPDQDHIGGLIGVLERYGVGMVIDAGLPKKTTAYEKKETLIEEKEIPRLRGRRGMVVDLGGGATARILFPDRAITAGDANAASLIMQIDYGEHEFLLSGDAPERIEEYVARLEGEDLQSEVLKAGHHGSKTSTGVTLLGFADPDYVVISAGADNRYGHPHEEVLKRIRSFEAEVLQTKKLGAIKFTTDGRVLRIAAD